MQTFKACLQHNESGRANYEAFEEEARERRLISLGLEQYRDESSTEQERGGKRYRGLDRVNEMWEGHALSVHPKEWQCGRIEV